MKNKFTNIVFAQTYYLCSKKEDMPQTKNALIRLKYLDRLLSDRHHYYTMSDLVEKVNSRLKDDGFKPVLRRTIEYDIQDLQDAPFSADIEIFKKNGKNIYRYRKSSFSIFREELSREEVNLLREMLSTIGQFKGLDHFEWLNRLKASLEVKGRKQIISFSNNPYLKNSSLLGTLFDYISNKVVVRLSYHTFANETIKSIDFHPYLLKQYNDRWFLLGAADSDKKILTFPLDRIDEVEPLLEGKYIEYSEDLADRFEDIVGVTLYEDRPVEHVIFWVNDAAKGYVITKPIHGSQKLLKGEKDQQLRNQYPHLESGAFFTIDCIRNYELIRELCSYGKDLIVLHSDGNVKNEIMKRVQEMNEKYSQIKA